MEDLREEMTSLAGGKMEFETGWRAKVRLTISFFNTDILFYNNFVNISLSLIL